MVVVLTAITTMTVNTIGETLPDFTMIPFMTIDPIAEAAKHSAA